MAYRPSEGRSSEALALCDHVLADQTTALEAAYRIASLIDAIEGYRDRPAPRERTH